MAVNNVKKDVVANNLDNIKLWLSEGVSMKSIAKTLNISKTTLYKYLNELANGLDTIKICREPAVEDLENTMFMSATGYERKVKKYTKVKKCIYENGKKAQEWEEMVEYEETQYYPPDTTAGIFLLKNWANYMNEPRAMEIRKKEVELREKQIEANLW